jgi:hypothetical protein
LVNFEIVTAFAKAVLGGIANARRGKNSEFFLGHTQKILIRKAGDFYCKAGTAAAKYRDRTARWESY